MGKEIDRVLCLVRRDGCGNTLRTSKGKPEPQLLVLQLGDSMSFASERYVHPTWVTEVVQPNDLLRWLLLGKVPSPELAVAFIKYGAMSSNYITKYLTSPEGEIRTDWRDVDNARYKKEDSANDE